MICATVTAVPFLFPAISSATSLIPFTESTTAWISTGVGLAGSTKPAGVASFAAARADE